MKDAATTDCAARVPVSILGVPFDPVTTVETISRIEEMIVSGKPHYLVTANVDFLVQARGDIELRRILLEADLVLCDGTPVLWASALFGNRLPERVAGSDLVPELIRVAAEKGYRLYFLGASEAVARKAVARLRSQYPKLIVAGHDSPPFGSILEMNHAAIRRRIAEARPDILLVCFGCPKQEKWIAMNYRRLGVPVAAGVGGTLDFLAGELRRAPNWMRRTGTEWLYRLWQEPRRLFRRYARDLMAFIWGMTVQASALGSRKRPSGSGTASGAAFDESIDSVQLVLPARLDLAVTRHYSGRLPATPGKAWLLFAGEVTAIDSSGLAWLITLRKRFRARAVVLVHPSPALLRVLRRMRLADFFPVARDAAGALEWLKSESGSVPSPVTWSQPPEPPELRFHGAITAANARSVWLEAAALFSRIRPGQEWQLNLAEVPFIDTSGLVLLVRAASVIRQVNARVRLCEVNPAVQNVIRHGRVENVLLEQR